MKIIAITLVVIFWVIIGLVFSSFIWDSPVEDKKEKIVKQYFYVPLLVITWPMLFLVLAMSSVVMATLIAISYPIYKQINKMRNNG
jgi:peptidoglycan biosynthesis protein MviN/MurJ (putative lipid II flippase)